MEATPCVARSGGLRRKRRATPKNVMRKALRFILLLVNIGVAVLFLASTMAACVSPDRFVWLSLCSYALLPLLLVNVLFVVFWLLLADKAFLISALCIVLRCTFVPLYFQFEGAADASSNPTLRVATFNTHHLYGYDLESNSITQGMIDTNSMEFLRIVDTLQPDVLCLQEFTASGRRVRLHDSLQAKGYVHSVGARPGKSRNGTAIYSRYPLENVIFIDSAAKIKADVVSEAGVVTLFCVHLASYKLDKSDYQYIDELSHGTGSADSIRGTVAKFRHVAECHAAEWESLRPLIDSASHPVVVAGDFNDTPASYIYQHLRRRVKDSYCQHGSGFGTTYHGRFPAFRIDYILHSPSLRTLSYHRVRTDISDHYPIMAVLEQSVAKPKT